MGLFLNQQDKRSDLQQKIAADLREKSLRNSKDEDPGWDGSKDIKYLEGTRETTGLGWVWILIVLVVLGIAIALMIQGM